MAALAVVLGVEDSLALDLGTAVVTGATGLAGHDVLHGELVVAELALFFEDLVVVAIIAGRAGIDMQLVGEERMLEILFVLLGLEDDVPAVFFFLGGGRFSHDHAGKARPGILDGERCMDSENGHSDQDCCRGQVSEDFDVVSCIFLLDWVPHFNCCKRGIQHLRGLINRIFY